jgi:gliding motility-associated-like protein
VRDINPDNSFDSLVRKSLEGFEMPYDPNAWARFESQLPKPAPTKGSYLIKGLGAAALIGGIAVSAFMLWPTDRDIVALNGNETQETVAPADASVSGQQTGNASSIEKNPDLTRNNVTAKEQRLAEPGKNGSEAVAASAVDEEGRIISGSGSEQQDSPRVANPDPKDRPSEAKKPLELNLQLKMSRSSVCAGEEVRLMAVTGTGGLEFEWHFSDGEERSRSETARRFDVPGNYDVTLVAKRDGQLWERQASIEVRPVPKAEFEMERPYAGIPLYLLNATVQTGDVYRWAFSDGRVADGSETRQLFRRKGDAVAELMVTNAQGCTATAKKSEQVNDDFRLFAVNTFTPNGDGKNDDFLPKALEVMDCAFEMVVRDMNGREVHRTTSLDSPWNGRENNIGVLLPAGPYIWTVVLKNSVVNDPVFRGEITLQQ